MPPRRRGLVRALGSDAPAPGTKAARTDYETASAARAAATATSSSSSSDAEARADAVGAPAGPAAAASSWGWAGSDSAGTAAGADKALYHARYAERRRKNSTSVLAGSAPKRVGP